MLQQTHIVSPLVTAAAPAAYHFAFESNRSEFEILAIATYAVIFSITNHEYNRKTIQRNVQLFAKQTDHNYSSFQKTIAINRTTVTEKKEERIEQ